MSELTDEQKNNALSECMVFVIFLLMTPISAWWYGFVLLHVYNWFILPIHGAPVLTIGNMLGISMIIQASTMYLMNWNNNKSDTKSWTTLAGQIFSRAYLLPAVMLFFGWLYQRWFM